MNSVRIIRSKLATLPVLSTLVLIGLLLSSCIDLSQSAGGALTVSNTSPSTLTVTITISEDQSLLHETSQARMHFSSSEITNPNPNTIDFQGKSKIYCNDNTKKTYLNFDGTDYVGTVKTDSNDQYNCAYSWNGGIIGIPTLPQTQLQANIQPDQTHSTLVTINYNTAGGDGCDFRVDATDGTHSASIDSKKNTGSMSGLNVSTLSGPGSWVLTRTCKFSPSNAGFASIDETVIASSTNYITWNAG